MLSTSSLKKQIPSSHRTPNLTRMAREGRKFTHFNVTAGVCTPSRSSLITGCYSQRVGMHTNPRDGLVLRPLSPYGLHPEERTIAEVLKAQGYATGMVGKWHLGDQPEFLPTRQGFDWFFGVPYSDDMTERVWKKDGSRWPPLPLMENETVIEAPCDRNGLTKRYTERAMAWIAEHKEEPFFLYFPQAMPGSTKTPFSSDAFRGKSKNGPWGDSIEGLDWSLGVMLDQLVELGIAENTFVIWTSDNGAPINADPANLSRGSNLPLHGRGYTTSEGAFRVPTIVWQPGRVPANTVCDELNALYENVFRASKTTCSSTERAMPDTRKQKCRDLERDTALSGEQMDLNIYAMDCGVVSGRMQRPITLMLR
jgi:arylsulfatase A